MSSKAASAANKHRLSRAQWAAFFGTTTVVTAIPLGAYAYNKYSSDPSNAHTSKSFLRWLLLSSPFSSAVSPPAASSGVDGTRFLAKDWSVLGPPVRRTPLYVAGGAEGTVARAGKLPPLSDPTLEIGDDLHTVLQSQRAFHKSKPLATRIGIKLKLAFEVSVQVFKILFFSAPVIALFLLHAKFPHRYDMRTACIALQKLLIRLGPTYVKLGQWMGTRHDLFPKEICYHLSVLCDKAPTHSWEHTERELRGQRIVVKERVKVLASAAGTGEGGAVAVEGGGEKNGGGGAAMGVDVVVPANSPLPAVVPEESTPAHRNLADDYVEVEVTREESLLDYLDSVDRVPINSGSVAQVHHAVLKKDCDGVPAGTHLAIKVLHPRVRERIWVDVWVLHLLARGLYLVYPGCRFADPMVHWYEFSSLLLSQLNFEREADNMDRFQYNFRDIPQVVFPTALRSLTNADVLVETFELGWKLEDVVVTKKMADLGVRMFLKMIFEDNFLHADLHTGNVLIRRRSVSEGTFTNDLTEGSEYTHVNECVVLDPGLVTTLSPYDRETLLTTFAAVACGDSDLTADIALARSPSNNCQDVAAFKKDIAEIFQMLAPNYKDAVAWARTGFKFGDIQIGDVMMETLDRMKKHHVSIDGHFASLMTALIVGEAMGKKMNPEYNIFKAAAPYLMTALDGSDLKMLVGKLKEVYGNTAVVNSF